MLTANNKAVGLSAGFPDVCLSPVLGPFPFPNINPNGMLFPFSFNVWLSMAPAVNQASTSPLTTGDQAGTLHPTFMGPARHILGYFGILINFLPGTMLLSVRIGNNFNCFLGLQVLPSRTNVFYAYNAESAGGARPAGAPVLAELDALDALVASIHPCGSASPVESAWIGPGLGYLRIRRFSLDVPARVHTAVSALEAEGLETLVLDLRDNPGGELTAFLELAGDFLEPGSVLARAIDADGDEIVYRSSHRNPCRAPLWILVDRGTASAAELFAGCLQWHGRAVIAGERTYGKGTALKVVEDQERRAPVFAPAAMMVLPGGEAIHGTGVRPDVDLGEDEAVAPEGAQPSLVQFFTRDGAELRRASAERSRARG
ncbi:S41 family peptidase [Sorangium sp. So ce1014]|uniref:S41 family peptidase n=1 Tax=Sorangium sp. So ce1014 TaxID=3133326 RepID=UPI003F5EBC9F